MSDLAPFVAAAIRDRVVLELQKENAKLRKDLERENQKVLVLDALHGVSRTLRVAITGPTNPPQDGGDTTTTPVVYAVQNVDRRDIDQTGRGLIKINNCTLGDLARAEIYGNGLRYRAVRECPIEMGQYIDDFYEMHLGYFSVNIMRNANIAPIGSIDFDLPTISKDKLSEFEVSLRDRNEFGIDDIINFFGPDTPVVFDQFEADETRFPETLWQTG